MDREPAKVPTMMKGRKTPKENTKMMRGIYSSESRGNMAMKIGAIQGSKK